MRFLLEANLSPRLIPGSLEAGYAVRHVDEIGLLGASDVAIFNRAAEEGDVVITADSDFSMLLAARGSARPAALLRAGGTSVGFPADEQTPGSEVGPQDCPTPLTRWPHAPHHPAATRPAGARNTPSDLRFRAEPARPLALPLVSP